MKQAYLRWLGIAEAVRILDATLELTRENQRVNESLFRNGKITRDLVYRAARFAEDNVIGGGQGVGAACASQRRRLLASSACCGCVP